MRDGKKEIHRHPWKKLHYSSSRVFVKNYVRIYPFLAVLDFYFCQSTSPQFQTSKIGGFHS